MIQVSWNPKRYAACALLVEYANQAQEPLTFRLSQWLLFDTDGYNYQFELRNQFYEDDALRKLKEGIVVPGTTGSVAGWLSSHLEKRN